MNAKWMLHKIKFKKENFAKTEVSWLRKERLWEAS